MKPNSYIVDDFYWNPNEVRAFALQQEFGVEGNYPGNRTESFLDDSLKEKINYIMNPHWGEVTYWGDSYTGAYQFTTSHDRSWIHCDQTTRWAGICYLTPDAPLSGGTGIFKHKPTGLIECPKNKDGSINDKTLNKIYKDARDITKWDLVDRFANVYNRLVIYRGDFFHISLEYFGSTRYNGRLFQTFFFDTKD